jgi:type VII secretion integral membrane protein EccD
VVTPQARVDVALPLQSTVAELVPQLVRLSNAQPQPGSDGSGWLLTKLGGAPLSPGLTVSAAGLRDGDVIYLSPREGRAPTMLFDDVVDAIASATEASPGAWQPRTARLVAIAAGAAALLGATLLLFAYLSGRAAAPAAGTAVALVLLLVGTALSRGNGDADAGAACATVGLVAAAMAGMSALAPHHAWSLGAGPLALGLAAVAAYGVLAVTLVGEWSSWLASLALSAGLGTVTAAVVSLTGATPAAAAAVLAVVATVLTPAAPMIAMRLARLPMPEVPADIESFQSSDGPAIGPDVFGQTAAAQRILASLLGALGLVVVGSVVVLLHGDRPDQAALAGLLGLAWLLRSRSYATTLQRVVLLAAGMLSLAWLAAWLATGHHGNMVAGGAAALAVGGLTSLGYAGRAATRARRRRSPYLARLMDTAEFLSVLALFPLAGLVLNLYEYIKNAVHLYANQFAASSDPLGRRRGVRTYPRIPASRDMHDCVPHRAGPEFRVDGDLVDERGPWCGLSGIRSRRTDTCAGGWYPPSLLVTQTIRCRPAGGWCSAARWAQWRYCSARPASPSSG